MQPDKTEIPGAFLDQSYIATHPYLIEFLNLIIQCRSQQFHQTPFEVAEKIFVVDQRNQLHQGGIK